MVAITIGNIVTITIRDMFKIQIFLMLIGIGLAIVSIHYRRKYEEIRKQVGDFKELEND